MNDSFLYFDQEKAVDTRRVGYRNGGIRQTFSAHLETPSRDVTERNILALVDQPPNCGFNARIKQQTSWHITTNLS